eukprot:1192065-Amphidinium_carterae.1
MQTANSTVELACCELHGRMELSRSSTKGWKEANIVEGLAGTTTKRPIAHALRPVAASVVGAQRQLRPVAARSETGGKGT